MTNSFKLRRYEDSDYDQVTSWLRKWWHTAPTKAMLPKTGYVVEANGLPSAAGFLMKTDGCIAVLEFTTANPDSSAKVSLTAINMILEQAKIDTAAHYGADGVLMIFTDNRAFGRMAQRVGFEVGNQTMTSFVYANGNDVGALKDCEAEAINTP